MEVVTQSVNAAKKLRSPRVAAPYRGVYKHRYNKWIAQITIDYKKIYLGIFNSPEEAALAYNKASLELRGEGFPLNEVVHAIQNSLGG